MANQSSLDPNNSASSDDNYDYFDNFNLGNLLGTGDDDLLNPLNNYQKKQYFDLIEVSSDLQKYYLIVLAVIGVPSNALTVATILSMHALSPATFFVVLLAIFDGCALIVKLTGNQLNEHEANNHTWYCKMMDPLSIFFSTTANWVLVLICLERFISVCYPLKKAYLFTKRRSYISAAILVGSLFTLIMTTLGVSRTFLKGKCTTLEQFEWFYSNVWLYLNVALFIFIPFVLIAFLTAFIIYGLRQSRKHRMSLMRKSDGDSEEMKVLKDNNGGSASGSNDRSGKSRNSDAASGQRKSRALSTPATPTALHNQRMLEDTARVERTITLMLIAAAVIFLVLCLPMTLYYLIQGFSISQEMTVEKARWTLYHMIAFLFIDSSHAVNFFLYFFTAKRFRVQLIRIVTGRASCWGRRLTRRGRNKGSNGNRTDNGPNSKTATSNSTASTGLASNGPRVE